MTEGAFWDLLLTDGALSHWQMSHERLSLSFSTVLSTVILVGIFTLLCYLSVAVNG